MNKLFFIFVGLFLVPMVSGEWATDTGIVTGISTNEPEQYPTIFQNEGTWYLLIGSSVHMYGYNWTNGVGPWQWDEKINTSIPQDVGQRPTTFYIDGTLYMLSGSATPTRIEGKNWTGSTWQGETTIISGLVVRSTNAPEVFMYNGEFYALVGRQNGNFDAYKWNGSGWDTNQVLNASLPDIGSSATPEVFMREGTLYMIAGNTDGLLIGFNFTGTNWQQDPNINSTLIDAGSNSHLTYFMLGSVEYLIVGNNGFGIFGYRWNQTPNPTTPTIFSPVAVGGVTALTNNSWFPLNATSPDPEANFYYFNKQNLVKQTDTENLNFFGGISPPSLIGGVALRESAVCLSLSNLNFLNVLGYYLPLKTHQPPRTSLIHNLERRFK